MIKTDRYCISKKDETTLLKFKCKKCSKSFTIKLWMKVYENKCGETIEELKDQNHDLIM